MSATSATAEPGAPAPGNATELTMQGFAPPNRALATFGLALASFMQVLDTTIANVSLPTISGSLGGSANQAIESSATFNAHTARLGEHIANLRMLASHFASSLSR